MGVFTPQHARRRKFWGIQRGSRLSFLSIHTRKKSSRLLLIFWVQLGARQIQREAQLGRLEVFCAAFFFHQTEQTPNSGYRAMAIAVGTGCALRRQITRRERKKRKGESNSAPIWYISGGCDSDSNADSLEFEIEEGVEFEAVNPAYPLEDVPMMKVPISEWERLQDTLQELENHDWFLLMLCKDYEGGKRIAARGLCTRVRDMFRYVALLRKDLHMVAMGILEMMRDWIYGEDLDDGRWYYRSITPFQEWLEATYYPFGWEPDPYEE